MKVIVICLFVIAQAADARRVTGEVVCQGKGLSEVIVTDGESFTTTAVNGKFSFELTRTEVSYIGQS